MFQSDSKSRLDRLKKGLYSRNVPDEETPRHEIHGDNANVRQSWDDPIENGDHKMGEKEEIPDLSPKRRYAYKIVFLVSALFLVIAFAVAAFTFLGGGNFISVDNVDIRISGPASIGGGEPLSLDVSVVNNNKTPIELVDLIVEYPEGTKDPADPTKDLSRLRVTLGDIGFQSVAHKSLSSLMFGQEGDIKDIKFTAEYRTADSNAIFFKEKIYHVTISSSPVLLSIETMENAISGEPVDVRITVSSNTTLPVNNVLLSLSYPFGLSMVSSDPKPTWGDNVWNLGDLAPGSKRVVNARALVVGEDSEDRAMRASVGIQSDKDEREMATTIVSVDHTFTIEKPFLGLDLVLDGSRSDVAIAEGRTVRADIIWTNNSDTKIVDSKITVRLGGNALSKNSVVADDNGHYDSISNTITWQAGRTIGLDTIPPGETGRVSFSLSPVSSFGSIDSNPEITMSVSAEGDRVDLGGSPQTVNTAVSRSIKMISNLAMSARAIYSQGPFANSGPMPPAVDKETTYTVIWTVTNTSNTITGAKAVATLPQWVSFTGEVTPSNSGISYDSQTGTISWLIGEVPKNADIGSGAKQVAFKIKLKPSANQAGKSAELISETSISGTDIFAGVVIKNMAPALSTAITTDLLYKSGDDIIQK